MKLKHAVVFIFIWGVMVLIFSVMEDMTRQQLFTSINSSQTYKTHNNHTAISATEMLYRRSPGLKQKLALHRKSMIDKQNRPTDDQYGFNVSLSDVTPVDRAIPDTRPMRCLHVVYNIKHMSKVSVIIPFYNEALSMLLRTIHSVLSTTPDHLLQEIIIIDDASTFVYLKKSLQTYLKLFPKIRLLRNEKRIGLIGSRVRGAAMSRAPVLMFLDGNTECNKGWLEPILTHLQTNPSTAVQPFIDGIDVVNLLYAKPDALFKSAFSWDLRYVWLKTPLHIEERIFAGEPYFTPTLVGCAIAITKTYFNSIGQFDTGQLIWGGENIELAFRTWMCGGYVITLPCSHVGHMFKDNPYIRESNWVAQVQCNLIRIAEVWMDDDSRYFYWSTAIFKDRQISLTEDERKTLSKRREIRQRLKCHNFQWYLNNVIPELPIPSHDAMQHGEITNYKSRACWFVMDDGYIAITYECFVHCLIPQNTFTLDIYGLLRYMDYCVKLMYPLPTLKIMTCPQPTDVLIFSRWSIVYNTQHDVDFTVYGKLTVDIMLDGEIKRWCVPHVTSVVEPHINKQMPQVLGCDVTGDFQLWSFTYRFDRRL